MEEGIAQRVFPGAVVYISRRGKVVSHEAFGSTTYEPTGRPICCDDLFDLASLTKLYTTALVLRLVGKGVLDLCDPVRRHVPEVAAAWTVQDLLAHRTGTTADLLGEAVRFGIRPCEPRQEDTLWQFILQCKPVVALNPGQSHYSDVDFLLAQAVCERATGRRFAELVASEVLAPLGLRDTCFCPTCQERCVPTEVDSRWRHRLVFGEVHDEIAATLGGVAGHAGLFATASDVGRFCEAWLQERENRRRGGLGGALEPHSLDFGLGWRLCNSSFFPALERHKAVGHLGFTGTAAFLFPRANAVFVMLANRVYPKRDVAPSRLPLLAKMAGLVAEACTAPAGGL